MAATLCGKLLGPVIKMHAYSLRILPSLVWVMGQRARQAKNREFVWEQEGRRGWGTLLCTHDTERGQLGQERPQLCTRSGCSFGAKKPEYAWV